VIQKAGLVGDQDSPNRQATMATLLAKRKKLLDLHYQDRISAEAFGEEDARLTRKIEGCGQRKPSWRPKTLGGTSRPNDSKSLPSGFGRLPWRSCGRPVPAAEGTVTTP